MVSCKPWPNWLWLCNYIVHRCMWNVLPWRSIHAKGWLFSTLIYPQTPHYLRAQHHSLTPHCKMSLGLNLLYYLYSTHWPSATGGPYSTHWPLTTGVPYSNPPCQRALLHSLTLHYQRALLNPLTPHYRRALLHPLTLHYRRALLHPLRALLNQLTPHYRRALLLPLTPHYQRALLLDPLFHALTLPHLLPSPNQEIQLSHHCLSSFPDDLTESFFDDNHLRLYRTGACTYMYNYKVTGFPTVQVLFAHYRLLPPLSSLLIFMPLASLLDDKALYKTLQFSYLFTNEQEYALSKDVDVALWAYTHQPDLVQAFNFVIWSLWF